MNHQRRVRSPPFGYDPRTMNRVDVRPSPPPPGPDYDDPYGPLANPYEPTQPGPAFIEPHTHYIGHRDNRLPSTYRTNMRESYPSVGSAPYKILCITNINPKVGDGPVKEALTSDFNRFGDVSVSICHDSGERLAYIYFRTYEEAREARHMKSRTILFDRLIEIEPIYEPRTSPVESPPPPQPIYSRRRSITPPEQYYNINSPMPQDVQRLSAIPSPIPHHRGMSPPPNFPHSSRYPMGPGPSPPLAPGLVPYGRYSHVPPSHLPPQASPYSSPPHESFRSYPPEPFPMAGFPPYHPSYGQPPMSRDRDRAMNEDHMARSPRSDPYYPVDYRGYPTHPLPPPSHSTRSPYSSSSHPPPHPSVPPHVHHQPPSSSYHSPNYPEPPRYMSREYRREKFESYSGNHDESRPSRVLIVNNIDATKSDLEIREVFEPYGIIEDAEVRKISPDVASALIKFSSMDAAYKAKTATNGRYIGALRCRIIYGKVNASRKLWIGGLNQTSTLACLEDEVSKYGEIMSLDYTSGRPYAYVEYESANQAQFAAHHLRGTLVPAPERKIRIEFVDTERGEKGARLESSSQGSDIGSRSRATNESWSANDNEPSPQSVRGKRSLTPSEIVSKRVCQPLEPAPRSETFKSESNSTRVPASNAPSEDKTIGDREEMNNNQKITANNQEGSAYTSSEVRGGDVAAPSETPPVNSLDVDSVEPEKLTNCISMREVVQYCPIYWFGQLVLRNFNFPSKIFMFSGKKSTIEKYLTKSNGENGDQGPVLRITQRWRLHPQPKLEEVKRRMQTGNLGMLIMTSRPEDQSPSLSSPSCKNTPQSSTSQQGQINGDNNGKDTPNEEKATGVENAGTSNQNSAASLSPSTNQSRPLKNLISYLEQKDAAGVISLNAQSSCANPTDGSKLLYAFPPGDFALNLLKRLAPKLLPESTKEEFLLGVIVGGTESKM